MINLCPLSFLVRWLYDLVLRNSVIKARSELQHGGQQQKFVKVGLSEMLPDYWCYGPKKGIINFSWKPIQDTEQRLFCQKVYFFLCWALSHDVCFFFIYLAFFLVSYFQSVCKIMHFVITFQNSFLSFLFEAISIPLLNFKISPSPTSVTSQAVKKTRKPDQLPQRKRNQPSHLKEVQTNWVT